MKLLILFCSLYAVAFAERLSPEEEANLFNKYLSDYRVKIGRADADSRREIFLDHYYDIEEHNRGFHNGSKSYERGINEFAHLTSKEFFESHTGYPTPVENFTEAPPLPPRSGRMATPGSWSWRDLPWSLGPTTNQGGCGSCTIFAVTGTIEAHMRIWYGVDIKLSEQEGIECTDKCAGTLDSTMYNYAKNGMAYDKDFKYVAKSVESCDTSRRPRVPGSKVQSYYRIPRSGSVATGMWYLANVGPLATYLCIPQSFGSWQSGVYDEENMNNCGWHAIMIVGYGNLNGKDYWVGRNSWGSGWGSDNGYFKIARGKNLDKLEENFTFPNLRY